MSIKTDVDAAKAMIKKGEEALLLLQRKCNHPVEARDSRTYRTNDEYDQTAYYATDFNCAICGAVWTKRDT